MSATQSNRRITVTTPLGEDILLFHRMNGTEPLGRLYEYEVEFLSEDNSIVLADILGQNICVNLLMANDQTRNFNGFVSRFSQHGTLGEYHCYRATVRPWLWFLTRTSNCRIFQEKTVPDIVKQVCKDIGFTDIEDKLTGSYPTWVYCVQYRETDFNFVSRLMEQEGIYYFFKHEKAKHTMVLSDSISAHESSGEVPYYPEGNVQLRECDHIDNLSLCQQVQPGTFALNDYDFEKPKANLFVKSTVPRSSAYSDFEQYDYPGEYLVTGEGDNYASCRIEELQSQFEQVEGGGNVRGCRSGGLFQLANYPREDQNREYLVVFTNYTLQSDEYFSASGNSGGEDCRCNFLAMDSKQPFRAQRVTPKPVVQGPQTAVVVGPSGKEIYTDEHGRVKVQFHWDREGKKDEKSSCWIRVSQVHAGKGFGGIDIPRIGEEVIVDFLEGDPDRPIITGRVYNADNKPPNELPADEMVSGLKSNSTPGGGGDNTIMLDDTKGEEKMTIHAQTDLNTTVGRNATLTVQEGDRTVDVTNGSYSMQAPTKITLTCGGSSITMLPETITIAASEIVLDGNTTMSSTGDAEAVDQAVEEPAAAFSGGGSAV